MKMLCLLASLAMASYCLAEEESPTLGGFAEYHINATDLVAFSGGMTQARLCEDCSITALKLSRHNEFFDQDTPIDLKRATELYLSHPYPVIYLGVDRQQKEVTYIRFGGYKGPY